MVFQSFCSALEKKNVLPKNIKNPAMYVIISLSPVLRTLLEIGIDVNIVNVCFV